MRYYVQGDAVKEDIILNSKPSTNTYTFELKLNGYKAETNEEGTIIMKDEKGTPQWFFETPFMTDANGKYSSNVSLKLYEEQGKTLVDVIADENFLNAEETAYPVTIDPTINDWNVIRDNFIASSFADSVYSSNTYMHTGYNSYFGKTRGLTRFYLPSLPSDSSITDASFNAYQTNSDGQQASVDLYRVTSDWTGSVTWNSQPTIGSAKESTVTSSTANDYWSWDITQLSKDWYNGVQANYGMMLKQQNEASSPYRTFNTVNSGSNTPRITINYTVDPIGMESFWMNTKDGVNPANGNYVKQKTDLQIPGLGVDVKLSRTYNSRKSQYAGLFGYGWTSTIEQQLVDSGSGPITLIDGDGTRHIFGEKIGGGYEAAGGIYLDLVKNGDGTYTITRPEGTEMNFNSAGKLASVVDPDGNALTYTYDVDGHLTTIEDASGRTTTLTYNGDGYVSTVTDPANNTITYNYDATGHLIEVIDAETNSTTYDYDAAHNMTSITDARNITTTIGYDGSDRITSIERPITIDGTATTSTTEYQYDAANNVTTVIDGENRRVDYTYNANGNIIQVTENPLDANNQAVTTYDYDNNNNLTQIIQPNENEANGTAAFVYQYDENGNIINVQLPESESAQYTYDNENNLTKAEDFKNNVSSFDYDNNRNQTEAIDPYTQSVSKRYNSVGNLKYKTYPMSVADNLIVNSSYELDADADNWPDNWYQVTQSGTTATYDWNATSKFGEKALRISNSTGYANATSEKVSFDAGETYVASTFVKTVSADSKAFIKVDYYDASGGWLGQKFSYGISGTNDWTRLHLVADNAPANTDQIQVSVGVNAAETGEAYFDGIQLEKGTVVSAYNFVENSSFERDLNGDGSADNWTTSGNLAAADGLDTTEVYVGSNSFKLTGEAGVNKFVKQHLNVSGDSNSSFTLSGWSKQQNANVNGGYYNIQIAIRHTDGSTDWSNANIFDPGKAGWQHVAAEVNPTQAFDSIDVYYFYYDQTGTAWFDAMRLEEGASHTNFTYDANQNYVTEVKDPAGNTVSLGYDEVGNVTSITDGKQNTTSFNYNANNELAKVTDPKLNETVYNYDGVGNRTSVTNAKNNTTDYNYNEFNQVSSFINPLNQATSYDYDKNGNLTKVTYENGDVVAYTYNALNRLVSVAYNGVTKWDIAYDANGNVTAITDENNNTKTYMYDKNNRVTQIDKGSSNSIAYGYDNNANVTSIDITAGATTDTVGMSYNPLNQLVALSRNSSNLANFTYDERGNISSIKNANGTYTAYEYNEANQLQSIKNYDANGNVLNYFIYSYDANANITSVDTQDGTVAYQYDSLNQLTEETLTDGTTISYEYDAVGNRTKKIVDDGASTTTTTYTYDAANELTAVDGQAFSYDANGNLTDNGEKTFIYNENNRLIEVKDATNTTLASFEYDKQGRRISKTTSTGTTHYHYDGDSNRVLYETDDSNNIVAEYTYNAQNQPVTMTKGGTTYFYHINGHGDVTALTDESGNIVAEYQYDAWGNILSQTGTMAAENPYRYAGYRYDDETGYYYLMARYYDADTGRFLTRDTFQGLENDPLSLNRYAYVKNNPIMYHDPTGNIWSWIKSLGGLIKKIGYTATFWALTYLHDAVVLYFSKHTSQLDWSLWWFRVVITGQAAIASRNFSNPWISGGITWAAGVISGDIAKWVKYYSNRIKSKRYSSRTIGKWITYRIL
ncbi:DNRLRE domain-containing protein [Bacillus tianshenii]|nr:DNRLRE domain-containing protein [Bacillus tianshenii]